MIREEIWFIEPRDSIIFRDGREFAAGGGASARTLEFPYPSTTTGAARARAILHSFASEFGLLESRNGRSKVLSQAVLGGVRVKGPLLATMTNQHQILIMPPAPADCVIAGNASGKGAMQVPIVPLKIDDHTLTDLKTEGINCKLAICGNKKLLRQKPLKEVPVFWKWEHFRDWLVSPTERSLASATDLGIGRLPIDRRTHVKIDSDRRAGVDGDLFETRGLAFAAPIDNAAAAPDPSNRLGLLIQTTFREPDPDREFNFGIDEGFGPLGGERRFAYWRRVPDNSIPAIPAEIRERVLADRACRIVLLTPAIFAKGFLPSWLLQTKGAKPNLVAAALRGYQVVSGFNLQLRRPRPTRRMCPAGSVFFLRFNRDAPDERIARWLEKYWFGCISDAKHDRHDGFGMAAIGTWDGQLVPFEEVFYGSIDQ
ncbi:MAG: hypothetical protein C4324_07265 [Blastocatellia bacterium]